MSRLVATLGGRRFGGDAEWFGRLRDSVHLWNALPLGLVAVTLMVGGFWLGSVVSGGDAAAAARATRTIHVAGRIITKNGIQYVATPARTVLVKGKPVRLAAQTVPLGHTTVLPGSTIRVATTVNDTATVVKTATVQMTVTAPASTVTNTTTVTDTTTVPVISTITVTIP